MIWMTAYRVYLERKGDFIQVFESDDKQKVIENIRTHDMSTGGMMRCNGAFAGDVVHIFLPDFVVTKCRKLATDEPGSKHGNNLEERL